MNISKFLKLRYAYWFAAKLRLTSSAPKPSAASGNISVYTFPGYGDGDMVYYTDDFASTFGSYWPAYCIDHGLHAPYGQHYYPIASQNNAIGFIMEHCYPNETWGLNWAEAQYLTQAEVCGFMGGHSAMYVDFKRRAFKAWIWAWNRNSCLMFGQAMQWHSGRIRSNRNVLFK